MTAFSTVQIENFLSAEKKRRSNIIGWIEKATEALTPLMWELYGDQTKSQIEGHNVVFTGSRSSIYFRYQTHEGQRKNENEGFYIGHDRSCPVWGEPVVEQRGSALWAAAEEIKTWIENYLPKQIEKKEISRQNLLQSLIL